MTGMYVYIHIYVSVQFSPQSCPTLCDPWTTACQASLSITNSWSLLELMSIESVMLSNHLILCHLLLLLPSIFPSIRVFSNESVLCIRCPKDWSFSFNISPTCEYSGLIFFRVDWLDLPAVQGTQESSPAPPFESNNSSVLSLFYITHHNENQWESWVCFLQLDGPSGGDGRQ